MQFDIYWKTDNMHTSTVYGLCYLFSYASRMKPISTNPLEEERRDTEVCYFKFINPSISITDVMKKKKKSE